MKVHLVSLLLTSFLINLLMIWLGLTSTSFRDSWLRLNSASFNDSWLGLISASFDNSFFFLSQSNQLSVILLSFPNHLSCLKFDCHQGNPCHSNICEKEGIQVVIDANQAFEATGLLVDYPMEIVIFGTAKTTSKD